MVANCAKSLKLSSSSDEISVMKISDISVRDVWYRARFGLPRRESWVCEASVLVARDSRQAQSPTVEGNMVANAIGCPRRVFGVEKNQPPGPGVPLL